MNKDDVTTALAKAYAGGLKLGELAGQLGVGKKAEPGLKRTLDELVAAGRVEEAGRGRYVLAAAGTPVAVGRIHVHPAGYGFVEREDGHGTVFVPAKFRGQALDGDRVRLYTWDGYKGTEGQVEEILDRGRAKLTGVVASGGRTMFLEPDDPRIATDYGRVALADGGAGARLGDCVVVEIIEYPTPARPAITARVIRVLGPPDHPATEIEKIIACADIPTEFPAEALAQARSTPQEVTAADLADRIDLRDREFLTIDPETARDHDDAIAIEPGPHGTRVWVAVADVSHYVRAGDALDREATIRGVSVYLPDRVIPMLPFELSSGICSLVPNADRCALVARIDVDDDGVVVDTGFAAAVIRSRARLDYPGVAAALQGDFRGRREAYRQWTPTLEKLDALARQLRTRRRARGTLELEIPEPKVVLDADDPALVRDVVRSKANEEVKGAYQLVEEFMIAANEAVGGFFARRKHTTVWRVHAPPTEEKLRELGDLLESFGVAVDADAAGTPRGMRKVLLQLEGTSAARALTFLVLRSLKQAVYDIENVGHFGLASDEYLHFTSPIRRYPDLLVHRLLKHHLHREGHAAGGGGRWPLPTPDRLRELAAASSSHERRAVEAEREAVSLYRALLMKAHVGEEFTGKVSGVASFGVFVELDEPFVEGLLKLEDLGDDQFDFDEKHFRVSGRRTGVSLTLGDELRVELANVSVARRKVDFRLASAPRRAEGEGRADDARRRRPRGAAEPDRPRRPGPAERRPDERRRREARDDRGGRGREERPGRGGGDRRGPPRRRKVRRPPGRR